MDWERAKNILIAIFLTLNIFLAYNLLMDRWSPAVSDVQIEAAENILKDRGITLKTELPKNGEKVLKLAFEGVAQFDMISVASKLLDITVDKNLNQNMLINGDKEISIENIYTFIYTNKSPKENIDISNEKDLEKYSIKVFKEVGIPTNNLILDYTEKRSNDIKLVFVQKKGEYKVFNNYIEVIVLNNGIKSIKCSLQKPSTVKKDESSIMPVYKVIFKNMWQNSGMVISSIDLGYTIDVANEEMAGYYERLYWRIRTEDGKTFFYDATTGEPLLIKQ